MPCCSSGSREFLTDQAPAVMDKINQCLFFFFLHTPPRPPVCTTRGLVSYGCALVLLVISGCSVLLFKDVFSVG